MKRRNTRRTVVAQIRGPTKLTTFTGGNETRMHNLFSWLFDHERGNDPPREKGLGCEYVQDVAQKQSFWRNNNNSFSPFNTSPVLRDILFHISRSRFFANGDPIISGQLWIIQFNCSNESSMADRIATLSKSVIPFEEWSFFRENLNFFKRNIIGYIYIKIDQF